MNCNFTLTAVLAAFVMSSSLLLAGEEISVRVDGLSCAYCAYSLEKNLKELKGVEKVEINLKEGIALLTLKDGETIEDETIKQRVKDSGFTPRDITREHPAKEETSQMETLRLTVTGLVCSGCVDNVKTALEGIPSVKAADVDLDSGMAVVTFEKGKVTVSQLIDAVEKAGRYKASVEKE